MVVGDEDVGRMEAMTAVAMWMDSTTVGAMSMDEKRMAVRSIVVRSVAIMIIALWKETTEVIATAETIYRQHCASNDEDVNECGKSQ